VNEKKVDKGEEKLIKTDLFKGGSRVFLRKVNGQIP
jgi:hypothetical protein